MAFIELTTRINAPVEVCFNLARSIDLHVRSMGHTQEQAVAGVTGGLIGLNETVTWRARHFGLMMSMTIKITELMLATSFTDEQLHGPFKKLKHRHIFQYDGENATRMIDEFEFISPFGIIGKLTDRYLLKPYLTKLLKERNVTIKQAAENNTN